MANYPGSASTDANLYIAVNNVSTLLNGALTNSGDNTSGSGIAVTSTSGFPTVGFITIDTEIISYTGISGNNFTGITRGVDGTSAASHVNNSQVYHFVIAKHHNVLKDEIEAIESDLLSSTGISASKAKNILINGGLEFWQRGTSFSSPASGTYTADRWKLQKDGTPTFTISQESTNIDSGKYSMKLDVTASGGGFGTYLILGQYFEGAFGEALNGKTVTVTARVKCSVANKINLRIADGAGSTNGTANVGTSFETISVTRTLGNIVNDGDLHIDIGFANGLGGTAIPSVATTYIDSIMMVIGSQSVSFIPTDTQEELAKCQRYYEKSYLLTDTPGTNTFNNVNFITGAQVGSPFVETSPVMFKVEKRAAPTMTIWNPVGTVNTITWLSTAGAATDRTANVDRAGTKGFHVYQTNNNTEFFAEIQWTADSEI